MSDLETGKLAVLAPLFTSSSCSVFTVPLALSLGNRVDWRLLHKLKTLGTFETLSAGTSPPSSAKYSYHVFRVSLYLAHGFSTCKSSRFPIVYLFNTGHVFFYVPQEFPYSVLGTTVISDLYFWTYSTCLLRIIFSLSFWSAVLTLILSECLAFWLSFWDMYILHVGLPNTPCTLSFTWCSCFLCLPFLPLDGAASHILRLILLSSTCHIPVGASRPEPLPGVPSRCRKPHKDWETPNK